MEASEPEPKSMPVIGERVRLSALGLERCSKLRATQEESSVLTRALIPSGQPGSHRRPIKSDANDPTFDRLGPVSKNRLLGAKRHWQ